MVPRSAPSDQETRQRLLDAASRLFAEHGFKSVTVRAICKRAGANVAAVNYHFRDKLGLYEEVIRLVADKMDRAKLDAMQAGEGCPPEEQLRAYIRGLLQRVLSEEEGSWMDMLIGREFADPTPAFELIIEKGIKPSGERLSQLMARILGCSPEEERVWQCALSVQGQCVFYRSAKPVFARLAPGFKFTSEAIERIASHVAEFSLAGIRAVAQQKLEVRR